MNIIARILENYFFELLGNYAHNSQTRIRSIVRQDCVSFD